MNISSASPRGGDQNNSSGDIISAFECPVCIDYCLPPIYQCQTGHLICSICLPRLSSCPTCRGPISRNMRNLAMEQVAKYLVFPCTNLLRGCDKLLSHTEKKKHEVTCEWRTFNCPFLEHSCKWQGTLETVMPHLVANHKPINKLLAQQQLEKLKGEKKFVECVQLARFIDQELQKPAAKLNYAICLHENGQFEECVKTLEELYQQEMGEKNKNYCYSATMLKLDEEVSRLLVVGHLLLAHCSMNNKQKIREMLNKRKQFNVIYSPENLDILIRLVHSDFILCHYSLCCDSLLFVLQLEQESKSVYLQNCPLSLDSFDLLSPEELTLVQVSFFRDGQELEEVKVNNFLDLTNIKRLSLGCAYYKKNVSFDLSESEDASIDYLQLDRVQLLNWSSCNWNVKELQLSGIPIVKKTKIEVQELIIESSSLDVSCLPQTTQKLTLKRMRKVFVSGGVELPNLIHLTLETMDVSCLSHFRSAPLTHIHLDEIKEVDVDLLPPTLTHLQITKNRYGTRVVGGVRQVGNLILKEFILKEVEECLSHLHTHNLLIDEYGYEIEVKELLQLMNKPIKTIVVGPIKWDNDDFTNYSSRLDRKAAYYLLEGGRGRAIEEEEINTIFA